MFETNPQLNHRAATINLSHSITNSKEKYRIQSNADVYQQLIQSTAHKNNGR
jgi:hypothetical protein